MCQKAWSVGKVVGKRHRKKGFGMGMGVRMEGSEPGVGTLRPRPGNAHKLRFNACLCGEKFVLDLDFTLVPIVNKAEPKP